MGQINLKQELVLHTNEGLVELLIIRFNACKIVRDFQGGVINILWKNKIKITVVTVVV